MNLIVERKSQRANPVAQIQKPTAKKASRSKIFPWKLLFGVLAIVSAMALLSNPIDQNSIGKGSSQINQGSLNGFSLGK